MQMQAVSDSCSDFHALLQKKTAQGKDPKDIPLHVCQCPKCFTAFSTPSGIECRPKCDLATCDEDTGVCNAAGGKGTSAAHSTPPEINIVQTILPWHRIIFCCHVSYS